MTAMLLDTCALLWWTLDPVNLSPKARHACAELDQHGAFISAVSVWEIGVKIKNNKLVIGMHIDEFAQKLQQISFLTILPVNVDIWLASLKLDWPHKDPADRIIVASAKIHKLSIISSDKIIADYYPQTIF